MIPKKALCSYVGQNGGCAVQLWILHKKGAGLRPPLRDYMIGYGMKVFIRVSFRIQGT